MSQKRPTRKKREGSRLYKFHSGLTRPLTAGMLKRMNLPERYWEVSFSKVLDGPFKKYVGKFLVDMGTALSCGYGMILNGTNGTGKTSVAALCLKQCRRVGGTGLFITADDYLRAFFNRTMFDDSSMVIDRCREVDLLVLDDLGKEAVNLSLSDSTAAPFELLMKDRVASVRSTIVTTNMAKEDFKKMYGESTALAVQGVSIFVHMTIGQKRAQEKTEMAAFYGLVNTK